MKKRMGMILWIFLVFSFTSCGKEIGHDQVSISMFAAASLEPAMREVIDRYQTIHPEVSILLNTDGSGKLCTQILEGYDCDIFFSASEVEIDRLSEANLVKEGTRADLFRNQVVLITYKGSHTQVTGFDTIPLAEDFALADESVPVGRYTREILYRLGVIPGKELSTAELKSSLGGLDINECSNVSQVKEQIKEQNNEIGTVYLSDLYGMEDDIEIIAYADEALSGKIVYPLVLIRNSYDSQNKKEVLQDFWNYLQSKESKEIFQKYMFVDYRQE